MAGENVIAADVLVVGGGVAGATAAVEAAKYGSRVVLMDSGVLGRSGSSCTSGGGIAFPSSGPGTAETGDSREKFFDDVIRGGEGISDQELVRVMVDEVADRVSDLEGIGISFQKHSAGHYFQRQGLGHSFPRSCTPLGGGSALMLGLRREVLHRGVRVLEDTPVFRLLKKDGSVAGAAGIDRSSGQLIMVRAGAVVLAAGSVTGLYRYTSANFPTCGDGLILGLEAGAELANLEFVEFTFIPAPRDVIISSGGATPFPSLGAHLYNSLGERFMTRYDPERMERSTRAIVVQAMEMETRQGRGPISMDAGVIDPEHRFVVGKEIIKKIKSVGVDPWGERFEWVTAVHSALGGLVISPETATNVPGLFACGEVSTGIHGGNRLSGVAVAECVVFGHRAGKEAARYALKTGTSQLNAGDVGEIEKKFAGKGIRGSRPQISYLKEELRSIARENIGIFRDASKLCRAEERFREIAGSLPSDGYVRDPGAWLEYLEVRNLALAGGLIARSALMREESRGQHIREDFPERDENWKSRSVRVCKSGEEMLFNIV